MIIRHLVNQLGMPETKRDFCKPAEEEEDEIYLPRTITT